MNSITVVAAVIYRDKHILIARRGPSQSGAGFWEFPGGKVESGEVFEQALGREILEELSVQIEVGEKIGEFKQQYPTKLIHLHVYWAKIVAGEISLSEHDQLEWIEPCKIDKQKMSAADQPFVEKIIKWDKKR